MDHKKKKWNDLEVKDKQKYTRSFLRTNFYKSLKGDAKETQSTYCYMILRGVVTTQGSRGVTGVSRKRAASVESGYFIGGFGFACAQKCFSACCSKFACLVLHSVIVFRISASNYTICSLLASIIEARLLL